ncbi:MAG: alpha-glucuronidase family glycosyl hydrolase [Chitinophagaceae bacterium]
MKKKLPYIFTSFLILILCTTAGHAENGYELWLRYKPVENKTLLTSYRALVKQVNIQGNSATIQIIKEELGRAAKGMLNQPVSFTTRKPESGSLIITRTTDVGITNMISAAQTEEIGDEGFVITTAIIDGSSKTGVAANTDIGLLYGIFHLLGLLQTEQNTSHLNITSAPKLKLRLLNHWDNLTRTVERLCRAFSLELAYAPHLHRSTL